MFLICDSHNGRPKTGWWRTAVGTTCDTSRSGADSTDCRSRAVFRASTHAWTTGRCHPVGAWAAANLGWSRTSTSAGCARTAIAVNINTRSCHARAFRPFPSEKSSRGVEGRVFRCRSGLLGYSINIIGDKIGVGGKRSCRSKSK